MSGRFLAALLGAGALVLPARSSFGAISIVAPPGLARPIDRVELAETAFGETTVVWCAVHSRRSARFAIVAELTRDASVEKGLDAWLSSLDLVTAPRVLAPEVPSTSCGEIDTQPVLELVQRGRGVVPVKTLVVEADGIRSVLADWNLPAFGPSELGVADARASLFAAMFEMKDGGGVSQAIRLRFDAARSSLPLVITPGWQGIPVSSYLIAPGEALPRSGAISSTSTLDVIFRAASHTSNYAEIVERFLTPYADVAWIEEASVSALDEWGFHAEDVAVPPLIDEYFRRARASSDLAVDPDSCATIARARLAGDVVDDEPGCAPADDLQLALAGIPLAQARVTRYATLSNVEGPGAVELTLEDGPTLPPIVIASSLEEPRCGSGSSTPPPNSTPGTGEGTEPVYVDPVTEGDYVYEQDEVYCGAQPAGSASSSDACDGDSSSESEDCDGDTSGSDDSYSGDSCSDDSSSDYEGDSCDGDDPPGDDSYSGDSCADGASATNRPTRLPTASIARSRPARPRLSVLTLGLSALLLALRRMRRFREAL